MTRIIPRELIRHLEWVPGQEPPKPPDPEPAPPAVGQIMVNLDNILKGKTFYDSNLADALQKAMGFAGNDGYIAIMPELIAAKLKASDEHDFYQNRYTVHTEENIGIDTKGRFYAANEPVLVLVNGGGILTPERIKQAYNEKLIDGSAKYTNHEFDCLLDGKIPDGTSINLYTFEEIKKGVSELPHRFGVVMPYSMAQKTKSTYVGKTEFLQNPLAIARNAGLQNLEEYFERAKDKSDDTLGCYHPFENRDPSTPQGRVLFLDYYYNGLSGYGNLCYIGGRFVGVAPEAHHTRKTGGAK